MHKLKLNRLLCISFSLLLFYACNQQQLNPIETVLGSNHPKIKTVVSNLKQHEIQILFTEVSASENSSIAFKDYVFQVDETVYFYPASTVKFPVAILALEKLNTSKKYTINTPFKILRDSVRTTFSNEITKIFAVSDNDAYNRLFEYLGQDYINESLKSKGILGRISHRVSVPDSDNTTTKPIVFYKDETSDTLQPVKNEPITSLQLNSVLKGRGYIEHDSLINTPKDFSKKNYLPVTSLHGIMKRLVFPNSFQEYQGFNINNSQRQFLLNSMKNTPKAVDYDPQEYYDSYVKFLVFGDTKASIPNHIEIYNKVGYAYGTLTDCAYIVNKKAQKSYIITATVLVNKNGIFNDDTYEYETVGIPFLAELGRQLLRYPSDNN